MLSDSFIPEPVADIIRLCKKFRSSFLSNKHVKVVEIVKDLKANIGKTLDKSQKELRHNILSIPSYYIKTSNEITDIDRVIEKKERYEIFYRE